MSLTNIWHLRRVADTSAKACLICHKPSTSVLITPDNKDYFYVCPVHLKDRNFCSAIVDADREAARKKEEAMAKEIELVKREYEEKQRRRKEKEKDKAKAKETEKKSKKDKKEENEDEDDEKEKNEKIDAIKKAAGAKESSSTDDSPRIFALHKNFYQMRLDRLRNIEIAKRSRERLNDPSLFPSVPKGDL